MQEKEKNIGSKMKMKLCLRDCRTKTLITMFGIGKLAAKNKLNMSKTFVITRQAYLRKDIFVEQLSQGNEVMALKVQTSTMNQISSYLISTNKVSDNHKVQQRKLIAK